MVQRELEWLSSDECFRLLRTAPVGRFVFQDDQGPVAIPVNFAVVGNDIVLRVEGGIKRDAIRQPNVAFEVDHLDVDNRSGWSVIARGQGEEVGPEHMPELMRALSGQVQVPWASGVHNVWLRIHTRTVTGRRLGAFRDTSIV